MCCKRRGRRDAENAKKNTKNFAFSALPTQYFLLPHSVMHTEHPNKTQQVRETKKQWVKYN